MERGRLIAIVGRPNVGKSALFNRILGRPVAIVEDIAGVTRDRHFARAEWAGRHFWLVDTGGFEPDLESIDAGDASKANRALIRDGIRRQVRLALEEADQVLFIVDGKAGLHPLDQVVADLLRALKKPIHLIVNKADQDRDDDNRWDFAELGLGEGRSLSGLHGRGVAELLDELVAEWPEVKAERTPKKRPKGEEDELPPDDEKGPLRVAVLGRPNVGKSSIVNALLKEERSLVSPVAGTTRDAVDSPLRAQGRDLVLVDTAGIRQKNKITDELERYSVVRSLKAIEDCHVALLVLDAYDGVSDHDERIAGMIHEAGRACVLVVNKWDKVPKDNLTLSKCEKDIRGRMKFLDYAPIHFISAKSGQRLGEILPAAIKAGDAHALRLKTGALNKALADILAEAPPPTHKGRILKVYYLSQTGTRPPAFALFVNEPKLLHFSTQRRIQKMLRERFDMEGTPMIFMLRGKKK
jgi:GTP-binding protein